MNFHLITAFMFLTSAAMVLPAKAADPAPAADTQLDIEKAEKYIRENLSKCEQIRNSYNTMVYGIPVNEQNIAFNRPNQEFLEVRKRIIFDIKNMHVFYRDSAIGAVSYLSDLKEKDKERYEKYLALVKAEIETNYNEANKARLEINQKVKDESAKAPELLNAAELGALRTYRAEWVSVLEDINDFRREIEYAKYEAKRPDTNKESLEQIRKLLNKRYSQAHSRLIRAVETTEKAGPVSGSDKEVKEALQAWINELKIGVETSVGVRLEMIAAPVTAPAATQPATTLPATAPATPQATQPAGEPHVQAPAKLIDLRANGDLVNHVREKILQGKDDEGACHGNSRHSDIDKFEYNPETGWVEITFRLKSCDKFTVPRPIKKTVTKYTMDKEPMTIKFNVRTGENVADKKIEWSMGDKVVRVSQIRDAILEADKKAKQK